MSRIPQNFIDDLLARVDIVEIIDSRVQLKKKGKEFSACCPFHNEKTPSFTVSPDKQFYHCFGCGAHGTALGFLMEYEHLSFVEAIESLAQSLGLEVPYETSDMPKGQTSKTDKDTLFAILNSANLFFQNQLKTHPAKSQAVDYLKNRGVSGKIAKEFQIGFAPDSWDALYKELASNEQSSKTLLKLGLLRKSDSGKVYDYFRSRILFPIHDYLGRVIGFGGRILGAGEPKYLNSPETLLFHKGKELYGLYQARPALKQQDAVIVVEGYMDVVALQQYGIGHVVATLGTAATREHMTRLFRMVKKIIFCFDGDRAGKDAAIKAMHTVLPLIREARAANFMFLPEGEDPDSFVRDKGKTGFLACTDEALNLDDFIFKYAAEKSRPDSISGKAGFIEKLKPIIRQLAPGIYRDMLVQRLASMVNMPEERVESYIFSIKKSAEVKVAPVENKFAGPRRHNLVHRAIAYLLEDPKLGKELDAIGEFADSQNPEIKLLLKLINVTKTEGINSAALYERLLQEDIIAKNKNKILDEKNMLRGDLAGGFLDTISNIRRQIRKNQLTNKVNTVKSGQELNELISKKAESET